MAEAGGGAIERRHEERDGAVEVHDGVGAGDVEREGAVQLDPFVDLVGGHARVRHERCRSDHEALGVLVYGLDRVRVVQRVEHESIRGGAPDFVQRVAAGWGGAEGEGDGGVAAWRARGGGSHVRGA